MSDEYGPHDESTRGGGAAEGWSDPVRYQRRNRLAFLPWLLGAVLVLVLAGIAGLGTAYFVAQLRAAPPPATILPEATPTASPRPSIAPTQPTATPAASPTVEPFPSEDPFTPAPAGTPRVHVVARGESLTLIALEYGVTVEEIIAFNELQNPDVIVPGQTLLIPPP